MEFSIPDNASDVINDEELLRRDFFRKHYDATVEQWSVNTFQLRDLDPPENYISMARFSMAPNPQVHASLLYLPYKLKTLLGYTLLSARDIRSIMIEGIQLGLYAITGGDVAHAGLFTWKNEILIEGSVEMPEILELKQKLFDLSIPTYTQYEPFNL